jgi:hypothetical protein
MRDLDNKTHSEVAETKHANFCELGNGLECIDNDV